MPPNFIFSLFLESKKYASSTCISSSKSAAPGPNWLEFGENVVRTFADKTVPANFDYRNDSISRPGRLVYLWYLKGGRLFETGPLFRFLRNN